MDVVQTKSSIVGERILVRELSVFDAIDIYINIRDKEVGRWTGPPRQWYLENKIGRFVCRAVRHMWKGLQLIWTSIFEPKSKKVFRLAVVLRETGKVIGVVSLSKNEPQEEFADIGFWISKRYWGKGLMSEALKLALKFGFEQLGLVSIEAWAFEKNVSALKVMEKCGFRLKEVVKDAYIKYNVSQNRLNYAILKSEFERLE